MAYLYFCSVSRSILRPLTRTLTKAREMLVNRAFVHHYAKFGTDETDFEDRFAIVEQVVTNYEMLEP